MDELTMAIIRARTENGEARQRHSEIKEQLEFLEASLFLACDYKSLGSNEETRKAAFKVNVLANNAEHRRLAGELHQAEIDKDDTYIVLENLLDQRRAYENKLRAEFIKGRYGVNITVEPGDNYDDFELSMAETYFESI